jgi:hypothetical protein
VTSEQLEAHRATKAAVADEARTAVEDFLVKDGLMTRDQIRAQDAALEAADKIVPLTDAENEIADEFDTGGF